MELILWRHAQTEQRESDNAHSLSRKGKNDAARVAKWLDANLPGNCKILVSPALRALQTAEALDRKFKMHPDLAPDSAPEQILKAANWPHGKEHVLIVGHQPALGRIASMLVAGVQQEWRVRRGGVYWIAQQEKGDASSAYLRAVITPNLIGKN